MRSRLIRGIKTRLRTALSPLSSDDSPSHDKGDKKDYKVEALTSLANPVDEYYCRYLKNNLSSFNSFALQSRSVLIRDVYARGASNNRNDFFSLILEIDNALVLSQESPETLRDLRYNREVLLSLGSYILDTSQSDLDTNAGLQIFRLVLLKYGIDSLSDRYKLQFVEALSEIRDYKAQDELAYKFDLDSIAPLQLEFIQLDRIARESHSTAEWVAHLNGIYSALGMLPVKLKEASTLPLLDRLTSDRGPDTAGPKVTVIMPTFEPDEGIFTALESLLHQTWSNLEIIVVDDASPEKFHEIFHRVERLDSRIRVLRQSVNGGAYIARNAGLSVATGEYITTHDDDDWSHPEKIATQAAILRDNPEIVATTSAHIRTTESMHLRRINAQPKHIQTNYSSLMFRYGVVNETGPWDTSIRGSDTELAARFIQHYGKTSVLHLKDKPLSFSRVWQGSLTSGEIYRGYFVYSRLLYRWAFRQWHSEARKAGVKPVMNTKRTRPFAIPTTFEPGNRNMDLGTFDVVFVTDYSRHSKFANSVLQQIESCIDFGLHVGYMHINSPQTQRRAEIPSRLFELQQAGNITQIGESNRAKTKLLVVYDASIGMFLDTFRTSLVVERGIVVDDRGALIQDSKKREASHARTVLKNLDQSFNTSFQMVGAASEDHGNLKSQLPPQRILDDRYLWTSYVSNLIGEIVVPSHSPTVGFHTFGNRFRWPSDPQTFQSVYVDGAPRTIFYGLIKPGRTALGDDTFASTEELDRHQTSLAEFFRHIDFWAYFPHDRLRDRPWKSVLQALQAGKVVILPHRLEHLYGTAAVYAEPKDVSNIVQEYCENKELYLAQARRGQKFVASKYSSDAFVARLRELMPDTEADQESH